MQTNAMWRGLFERRRCLVPADGFYEWMKLDAKTKKPYAFAMRDALPFAFAGLWDAWKDPANGEWLQTIADQEKSGIIAAPIGIKGFLRNHSKVISLSS